MSAYDLIEDIDDDVDDEIVMVCLHMLSCFMSINIGALNYQNPGKLWFICMHR